MLSESNDKTLMALRIIWIAMLGGQVAFGAVIFLVGPQMQASVNPAMVRMLFYVALAMLVLDVPIAYLIRAMIYRGRRAADGTMNVRAYSIGNIVFYAMLEGVSLFALFGWMMSHGKGPHIWVAMAALILQGLNFPTGQQLQGGAF